MSDVVQFLSIVLPTPNTAPQAAKTLISKFVDPDKQYLVHRCCGESMALLKEGAVCNRDACKDVNIPESKFVEVPLDLQLKEIQ